MNYKSDRNSDPLLNLADALSEEIVAAPAATLVHDAGSDPGGPDGSITAFDRIAVRAAAQSRRRRMVERLRTLLHALPGPVTWTSAMAGVAGIFVMGIVGGLYFHQQAALAPPPVVGDRVAAKYAPAADGPMAHAENSAPPSDHAAAVQPAQAAAPPAVAPARPPAPAAAAGVADEAKRVRTVQVQSDSAQVSGGVPPSAPRVLKGDLLDRALRDYQLALSIAEQGGGAEPRARVSQFSASQPAASSSGPAPRARLAARQADAAPSFQWPLRGRVMAPFGSAVGGVPNNGIDVSVPRGTDIHAAEEGIVAYAGDLHNFGNMILLRHRDGFLTVYAHAQSLQVKVGESVRRGQVIAKSGQTGAAGAPQLHFEIRKGADAVDPAQYLPPPG
jgi:murein DD-endopeptidase MepM/ murein hydrolase activator NlpD